MNFAMLSSPVTGGVGPRPFCFLISDSDSVVYIRAVNGSMNSTIALEMSLEFRKVVRA